jgi:REP element-mobilizing transposase RayT
MMKLLPQRRSPRLNGYNYSQNGAYFVTICTHNRTCIFGEIIDGQMQLNELGAIAVSCWEAIPQHYPQVELDAAVVMPNHVHGIIVIVDKPEENGHEESGHEENGHDNVVSLLEDFGKPVRGSLSSIIRSYKAAVTYTIMKTYPYADMPIWQGRFYDHIIRNERALNTIREYVVCNPAKWAEDSLYSNPQKDGSNQS